VLLAIPTLLLSVAPNLGTFAGQRIAQGLCMASAFALTLAYLGEECSASDAGSAFAAYITGNVASNLFGRLISAAVADHLGLPANFLFFAALNLAGALLALATIHRATPMMVAPSAPAMMEAWRDHLRNPQLRAAFGIGFCILFAFIGTFTFVNFVLVREPFMLSRMQLGFVYFVFLPSIVTTLMAGAAASRFGVRPSMWASLAVAAIGLLMLLSPALPFVLGGMVLVAVGTFFAQAVATGFLSKATSHGRSAASGMYLAAYFSGGLVGTAVLGQLFDRVGWPACVAGIGAALLAAALLTRRLAAPP
jgi:predicted MFS family arabinose efflux permease